MYVCSTKMYAFVSWVLMLMLTFTFTQNNADKGCTAPNALPNQPFLVVWNVPSRTCDSHHIFLNLTAYGITTNKDDKFIGDNMTIFYNYGDWPHYSGRNVTPVNGGIPQEGNLSEHLRKASSVVKKNIPDTNFDGLAVIDFEAWRPEFQMNFGTLSLYQVMSKNLVKKQHPTWTNKTRITEEATRQFDSAARKFMEGSIQLGSQLRPKAYWGYYGFPRCWGPSKTNSCTPAAEITNDNIGWFFKSSTGLYPRIYTDLNTPLATRHLQVQQIVHESLRVQVKWTTSGLGTPVLPYTLVQNGPTGFFQSKDLEIAIQEPAYMGASGVVIWGSSSVFHTRNECQLLKNDLDNVFGPFVKNVITFTQNCTRDLCNEHGRCVRRGYEAVAQNYLIKYGKTACRRPREEYENTSGRRQVLFGEMYARLRKYDDYVCRCLAGWSGEYCNKHA